MDIKGGGKGMKRYILETVIYGTEGTLGNAKYTCEGCTILDSASSTLYFMNKEQAEKYVSELAKINATTVNKCIYNYGKKITDIELDRYEKLDDSISDDIICNIAKNSELCMMLTTRDFLIIMLRFISGLAIFSVAGIIAKHLIHNGSVWVSSADTLMSLIGILMSSVGIIVMILGGVAGFITFLGGYRVRSIYRLESIITDADDLVSEVVFRGCVVRDTKSAKRYGLIGDRGLSVLRSILRDTDLNEDNIMEDKRVLAMMEYCVSSISYNMLDSTGVDITDRDMSSVGIGIYNSVIWVGVGSLIITILILTDIIYSLH